MSRFLVIFIVVISNAYAEDPFACVEPDVRDAFLGNTYAENSEYSDKMPEDFVDFLPPENLTLIGSVFSDSMTSVVFGSSVEKEKAFRSSMLSLSRSGWVEKEDLRSGGAGGFQVRSNDLIMGVLCKDGHDAAVTVLAGQKSGKTLVSYIQHSGAHSCAEKQVSIAPRDPTEMMRVIPALSLPAGARATNTGMGGSGHQVSSHVDVSGLASRSDLASFIEEQIGNQGWEFQTSWSSHNSSGSVWVRETGEDGLLVGVLHLFDSGADPIRVRFSVSPSNPSGDTYRGSWSGSRN